MIKITKEITWHEIGGATTAGDRPDIQTEVLVYDGYLDDVLKGYLDVAGDEAQWIEVATDNVIEDPQFWAEMPFPDAPVVHKLPDLGEEVDIDRLLILAMAHDQKDVIAYLERHGVPGKKFVSDGCSMWLDSWASSDLYPACFWHDVRYWCGMPGDVVGRVVADAFLAQDVATITGNAVLARSMFGGVGCFGSDHFNTTFRWGYGRS